MISAIHSLAITTGANRLIKGCRIEHVCGDPNLGPKRDRMYGLEIAKTAIEALTTDVYEPTLFEPLVPA